MKLLISLSALLLSIILVQMGIGALRPFDTISGQALGFTPIEIGIIASGHFVGFLLGCVFSPSLVKWVGHSRAYAYVPRTSLFIATIIQSRRGRAAPAAPPDHQTQNSDGAEN